MAKRKLSPLEEFSKQADAHNLSYGGYSQLLYREECMILRKKEEKKRAKTGKTHK